MAKSSVKGRSTPPSRHPAVAGDAPSRRSSPPPARSTVQSPAPAEPRRKFRGGAPWASRHAAKQAAEAQARNQEPPRPGSARATLRSPEEAEQLKARVGALHGALTQLRSLKKQLPERFFEAGRVLKRVRDERLFDAKGYASFEAFVEREVDLGSKTLSLRLARLPEVFSEDAAREYGLEPLIGALESLEQAALRAPRAGARPSPIRGR